MALVQSQNKIKLYGDQNYDDAERLGRSIEFSIFTLILSRYQEEMS